MTRSLTTCLMAILFIVATSSLVQSQDNSYSRKTLSGISAVSVLIEDLPDGARVLGLTEGTIQTDVELKLRLAGLRVVTMEEVAKLPGSPMLYVNVTLTDDAGAASVDVELDQDATLKRNGQFASGAGTWSRHMVIEHPSAQGLRSYIKDLTDGFVNAWLSVNPKR